MEWVAIGIMVMVLAVGGITFLTFMQMRDALERNLEVQKKILQKVNAIAGQAASTAAAQKKDDGED